MSNPTDAQHQLLARAAAGPEGVIDAPEDAKLTKALIKKGLASSLPLEGGASRLIITQPGRAAIAPDPEGAFQGADGDATDGATDRMPATDAGAADNPGTVEEPVALEPAPDVASTPPAAGKPKKKTPSGKLGALVDLLKRPEGATVAAMTAATGWQAHSVRGAMSGSLKKGFGYAIASEKTDAGRIYKITPAEAA